MKKWIYPVVIAAIAISGFSGWFSGHSRGYDKGFDDGKIARSNEIQPRIDSLWVKIHYVVPATMYKGLIRGENQLAYEGKAFNLFCPDYPFLYHTVIESYRQYRDSLYDAAWPKVYPSIINIPWGYNPDTIQQNTKNYKHGDVI